jgi:non-homologous end joining protein Ku
MVKPFAEVGFVDQYKAAVMDMVQQKVNGQQVISIESAVETTPVVDIMDALRKSIEESKKQA